MKAKDYLMRIKFMDAKINSRLLEIEDLRTLATKTTSVLGDDKVQSSGSQSKMADCVDKIVMLEQQLNAEIDKFVDFKREVLNAMDKFCDADCYRLIYLRYFQNKPWEHIAVEMNFTYNWVVQGLHQRALSQIQKYLDERIEE